MSAMPSVAAWYHHKAVLSPAGLSFVSDSRLYMHMKCVLRLAALNVAD